jgi:hypothetical protein
MAAISGRSQIALTHPALHKSAAESIHGIACSPLYAMDRPIRRETRASLAGAQRQAGQVHASPVGEKRRGRGCDMSNGWCPPHNNF